MQKNDTDALHQYLDGAVSLQEEAVKTSGLLCLREQGSRQILYSDLACISSSSLETK